MKCPFELPVHKVQPDILLWEIRDCNGKLLLRLGNEEYTDYIVQAVNGYEKLVGRLRRELRGGETTISKQIIFQALKEIGE